jgi:hypothetical protein
MLLNQLIEINQQGLVARSVSFGLMDDVEKNLKLCRGFVFNHDIDKTRVKNTTVGILDTIRYSFHSSSNPNVHLIVQEYGKGKSHFALTVANFFKLPHERDEVQGILKQLKYATSENNATLEALTAYKQRGKHLVICLSAVAVTDMRKHFFQVLNKELEASGITGAIAQQICREPLEFLRTKLNLTERQKAEDYLKSNFSTTVSDLEIRLTENDFQVIPIVKQVCTHIKGVNPDFDSNIQIEKIIDDLINNLCKGENATFQGILILFDELYEYLRSWSTDPTGSGGLFLQNITDACEKYKGKIALVSLTQRKPSGVTPPKNSEDYKRLVSRIEITSSTYNPKASLELVLDGLLNQLKTTSEWQSFWSKWENDLKRKSLEVFGNRAEEYYRGLGWKHNEFYKHLTIGCFPLHPLTSYLLCNLSFAQGRSVIDFIQKEVKDFIGSQPIEKNNQLNLIYPVALVDAFESNFANPESNIEFVVVFSDYKSSINKLEKSSDVDPDEIAVLKALLLFYTSGNRLKKSDKENHEEILQTLTGLSPIRIAEAIKKLCKDRELLYLNLGDNTYKFYSGGKGIDEIRVRIKEEAKNRRFFIDDVEKYLNENIGVYTSGKGMTIPQQFVDVKKLNVQDWVFQNKVFSVKSLRSQLQKNQPFKTPDQSGIVAYVIAETSEEILLLEKDVKKLIEKHSHRDQFAVAISERPIEELAQLMLEQQCAEKLKPQEFGAALSQIKGQYVKQIENEIKAVFKSIRFYSHIIEDIPQGDKTNISVIISEILEQAYSLIPPIDGNDKLYLKSAKGSTGNAFIAKRILEDDLRPEALENAYKSIVEVYVKSWGLLKFSLKTKKYEVTIPTQKDVRKAWDKISELTSLGEQSDKITQLYQVWEILSSPPYGYNAYTFTVLLTAWLAYHRNEVLLEGSFGIPQKKSEQVRSKIEPIKSWVSTNILDKPKEFISEWIIKHRPRIVRRKPSVTPVISETYTYDLAKQKCEKISSFIADSGTPDKHQNLVEHQQSLEIACSRIEQSFAPVIKIEELIESRSINSWADVSEFTDLYSDLQSPLIDFAENGLTVICTTEQQRRYTQASQSAREKISEAIALEGDRHTKLATEEACGVHKANLTQAINQLKQIENIPPRFIEGLQKALEQTERVITEIRLSKEVDACKTQIQAVYATLSDTANQQDYLRIRNQIDTLANDLPNVQQTEIYRSIVDSIEEKQDFLVRQLAEWESQYDISMSRDQASSLQHKISTQSIRYTDELSRDRLQSLLDKLNNIILERRTQENEKQGIQNLLITAKAKLNDIKNTNSPLEYIKYYLQLSEVKLDSSSNDEQIEHELGNIKSESFKLIEQRLSQIIDLCSRRLEENSKNYTQLKSLLPKLQDVAARSDELTSFRIPLNNALNELEEQYNLLQKRIHDNQVMASIRQHSLAKINTLHLCEEAISEIETKRLELNFSEDHATEVQGQIQALQDKANDYIQKIASLQEELSLVNESSQLTRLRDTYNKQHHIFSNSSQFAAYQQLESHINTLDEDIKNITQIQDLASADRAYNIATCDHAITQIDYVKTKLFETERFALSIQSLKDSLLQRKQGYLSKIIEFKDGLNNAATTKAVRQIRKQLNDSSSLYQGSTEVQDYNTVTTEADLLISLLQLFESQKAETSEDCDLEIAKLNQWEQNNPEITPAVRSRFETKLEELTNKQQELQASQRKSAKSWFESTQQRRTKIEQIEDQSEKILESNKLLKRIKERFQYEQLLEPEQNQFLEETTNFCNEIKNLDREEKILDLFQELPKTKRESVLKRLAELLEHSGEDS